MRRVVVTGIGLGLLLACNTPEPTPSPSAHVHTQAVVQPQAPAPAAPASATEHACGQAADSCGAQSADAQGCCGGAACGSGSEAGAACGGEAHNAAAPARAERAADSDFALTRITDPSEVCMVRNHFMGRPQLSVALANGTYYGCCAGCANRLLADPGARVAIDPISHNPVDKALAVLARTPRGNVVYFENEQNLSAFRAGLN